ncbi:hypothetical protein [Limnohabitans sp. Rim8]|uniref:hypothetical protein n=1 Tax=Limnohabitans sp. Rim8 TaxID=1100718 RepID=UPI0025F80561|nr:hypothetical protein [Limnohabitans sp. Rim8]
MTITVLNSRQVIEQIGLVFPGNTGVAATPGCDINALSRVCLQSPTASQIFASLHCLEEEVKVAFVNGGDEIVGSLYDPATMTVIVRTDKKYKLSEYPGTVLMDSRVLLYHELGHAVQHLVIKNSEMLTGESNLKQDSLTRNETFIDYRGRAKVTLKKNSAFSFYHFDYYLEYNNLMLHEYKISRELGLPIRSKYDDIILVA